MPGCSYTGCSNSTNQTPDLKRRYFPKERHLQEIWAKNIGKIGLLVYDPEKLEKRFVCDSHFKSGEDVPMTILQQMDLERAKSLHLAFNVEKTTKFYLKPKKVINEVAIEEIEEEIYSIVDEQPIDDNLPNSPENESSNLPDLPKNESSNLPDLPKNESSNLPDIPDNQSSTSAPSTRPSKPCYPVDSSCHRAGNRCVYPGCGNSRYKTPGLRVTRFPKDRARQLKWIENIGNLELLKLRPESVPTKVLCCSHFRSKDFYAPYRLRLRHLATPIHFLDTAEEEPEKDRAPENQDVSTPSNDSVRSGLSGGCCVYLNCGNSRKKTNGLQMFGFPEGRALQLRWIENIGNPDLIDLPYDSLRNKSVCANHFDPKYFLASGKMVDFAIPIHYNKIKNNVALSKSFNCYSKPLENEVHESAKKDENCLPIDQYFAVKDHLTQCAYYGCNDTIFSVPGLLRFPKARSSQLEWIRNCGTLNLLKLEPEYLEKCFVCISHFDWVPGKKFEGAIPIRNSLSEPVQNSKDDFAVNVTKTMKCYSKPPKVVSEIIIDEVENAETLVPFSGNEEVNEIVIDDSANAEKLIPCGDEGVEEVIIDCSENADTSIPLDNEGVNKIDDSTKMSIPLSEEGLRSLLENAMESLDEEEETLESHGEHKEEPLQNTKEPCNTIKETHQLSEGQTEETVDQLLTVEELWQTMDELLDTTKDPLEVNKPLQNINDPLETMDESLLSRKEPCETAEPNVLGTIWQIESYSETVDLETDAAETIDAEPVEAMPPPPKRRRMYRLSRYNCSRCLELNSSGNKVQKELSKAASTICQLRKRIIAYQEQSKSAKALIESQEFNEINQEKHSLPQKSPKTKKRRKSNKVNSYISQPKIELLL